MPAASNDAFIFDDGATCTAYVVGLGQRKKFRFVKNNRTGAFLYKIQEAGITRGCLASWKTQCGRAATLAAPYYSLLFGISTRSLLVVLRHWDERDNPSVTALREAGEAEILLLGMAELGEQATVVCSIDAVRETSKALFAVHGHLDQVRSPTSSFCFVPATGHSDRADRLAGRRPYVLHWGGRVLWAEVHRIDASTAAS